MKKLFVFILLLTVNLTQAQETFIEGTVTVTNGEACLSHQEKSSVDYTTCISVVHFFPYDKIDFTIAKTLCDEFGWELATRSQITEAYWELNYEKYVYGMLADGTFALPLQKATSHFNKGINLDAKGGNQGFFYVKKDPNPCGPNLQKSRYSSTTCIPQVRFYPHDNGTLFYANDYCRINGWKLATAEQVHNAWKELKYEQYSYGMVSDGTFAVPLQYDKPNFKKGANLGVTGGNQGFFYVFPESFEKKYEKPLAGILTVTPKETNPNANSLLMDFYKKEFYQKYGIPYDASEGGRFGTLKRKFSNGIGNVIQDKWNDPIYSDILNESLQAYINEKFPKRRYNESNDPIFDYHKHLIQNKDDNCDLCKITRYEFVGFFFPIYLKTLRMGTKPALNKQLSDYTNYTKSISARKKLESWQYYSKSPTASLTGDYIDPVGAWNPHVGPKLVSPKITAYEFNTFGNTFMTSAEPLPGKTVSEFKSNYMGDPLLLSPAQQQTRADFLNPLAVQAFPDNGNNNSEMRQIPNYLMENMTKESYAQNVALAEFKKISSGVGIGAATLFSLHLGHSLKVAHTSIASSNSIGAKILANSGAKVVAKKITLNSMWNIKNLAGDVSSKALSNTIGKAFGPFAIGAAVFMAGFQNTGGKAIEIAVFEGELKNAAKLGSDRTDWNLLSRVDKIELNTFLFKMLILEPTDFTYLVPDQKADDEMLKAIEKIGADWASKKYPQKYADHPQLVNASMQSRYASVHTNVAKNKTATQSTTEHEATAARAVDGNTIGDFNQGSVSHTGPEKYPWLIIDLGSPHLISSIKIFGRTDCCIERLDNYLIATSIEPFNGNFGMANVVKSTDYPRNKSVEHNTHVVGRYVRILLDKGSSNKSDYLNLAEVEVYGVPYNGH